MSTKSKTQPPKSSTEVILKTLLSGGIAGCCAKSTVAPFDRVKILLQAHHKRYHHLGVFSTIRAVVKTEGTEGLFRGNGAQLVRVFPYAAIQFTSYEMYKTYLKNALGDNNVSKLLSGSMAGLTAVVFTYPLDVVRARLAFQVAGEVMYTGIIDTIRVMILTEGGVRALYRAITPTMLGMVPYAGLSFYGFETLKTFLLEKFPHIFGKPCPQGDGRLVLNVPAKLICGGLAGAFAQTVAYPLDVARRKMQLSRLLPESHRFDTWHETLRFVFREHGIRNGIYRGLSVNYMKVTPMVAVSFCTYEMMKQVLGLDTHSGS